MRLVRKHSVGCPQNMLKDKLDKLLAIISDEVCKLDCREEGLLIGIKCVF